MSQSPDTPAKLELQLLGQVRILVDGVPVEDRAWTRRKSKALVKILALAPHQQMHREQLMELLWPAMEPELAANNLHKALHAARRALEPQLKTGHESRFLVTHDQQVQLRAPGELWIDVAAFEQRAAVAQQSNESAAYEAALQVYAGELLGEDRYEDWAAARREQLSLLAQDLITKLAQLYERQGQLAQSSERYRQLLAFDAANEAAHRQLMRLYARLGQRHQALQQYQSCCETLRKELDAGPEAATIKLHEQILAGQLAPTPQPEILAETTAAQSQPEIPAAPITKLLPVRRKQWPRVLTAVVLGTLLAALLFYYFPKLFPASHTPGIESIAVLPFANSSADAEVEYLSDGLTESIINSLAQVPDLRVLARTTSFRYKGRDADPQAVGNELKVQTVLTGKVLQRGATLVIQTELVDAKDNRQLWGAQYNRPLADLVALQSEIARDIADKLRSRLTREEQQRVVKQHTVSAEAYQAYLKGRYYWNRRTVPELQRAIEHFKQALALDPGYALAYAGLADCYHTLSNLKLPPTEAIPLSREAARKALELDEQLASAHATLAIGKWRYDWDWPDAEAEFKRAIELDPNYAPAHQWYGQLLTYQKKFEQGLAELKRAQQLDPLSLIITANLGLPPYFAHRYDEAAAQFRRALELETNFPFAHFFLGWAYEQQGNSAAALDEFHKAVILDGTPAAWAYLGHGQAAAGQRQAALETFGKLQALAQQRYVSPYYFAVICAGLNDQEQALSWLQKAVEDHSDSMVLLGVEPKFDGLRATPQFAEILRRVGLGN